MQLSNDASYTYNVLPLMRDLPRTLALAKVLVTEVEISGQDTAAELAKAQDAKIKAPSGL